MNPQRPNVLLIDNDTYIHEYFKTIIPELGYDISYAENIEKGYRMSRQTDFNIYLIDISIQGFSGIELLENIVYERPDADIVILSNNYSTYLKDRVSSLGIRTVLNKPFNLKEIITVLLDLKHNLRPELVSADIGLN